MGTSTIERIERFAFTASGEGGTSYSISVFLPTGLAEAAGTARVLFVLDADMAMGMAAEIVESASVSGTIEPVIVVGIGYGSDLMTMAKLRTKDFTPPLHTAHAAEVKALAHMIGNDRGGAERFLSVILDELAPAIARRCPQASLTGNILLGHSLGGLFVSYALLTRPDAFATFLISSPSLWWDGFAILAGLKDLPAKLAGSNTRPTVFVSVGSKEQDAPDRLPAMMPPGTDLAAMQTLVANARMVDAAQDFAIALRNAGLVCMLTTFEGATHTSVLPGMISRSLLFALESDGKR
ncbi:alpha/beta hydrolase-fold protein [uncultured Sphingosinicella sp.]|uniref:alpha/beta hydrolase n=1 Tax=uncultured Sphingosinicella sp. TaxID=478748 RepID=UPI0030DD5C32